MAQHGNPSNNSGVKNIHESSAGTYRRTSSSSLDDLVYSSPSAPSGTLNKQASGWNIWPSTFSSTASHSPDSRSANPSDDTDYIKERMASRDGHISPGTSAHDIWKSPTNSFADPTGIYRRGSLVSDNGSSASRRPSYGDTISPRFGRASLNGIDQSETTLRSAYPTSPHFFNGAGNGSASTFNGSGGNILERFASLGDATREAELLGGMKQLNMNENKQIPRTFSRTDSGPATSPVHHSSGMTSLGHDVNSPYASPKPLYGLLHGSSRTSSFGNGVWQPPTTVANDSNSDTKSAGVEAAVTNAKTPISFIPFPTGFSHPHDRTQSDPLQGTRSYQNSETNTQTFIPTFNGSAPLPDNRSTMTSVQTGQFVMPTEVTSSSKVVKPVSGDGNNSLSYISGKAGLSYDPNRSYDFVPGVRMTSPKNMSPTTGNVPLNNQHPAPSGIRTTRRERSEISSIRSPLLEEFRNNKSRKFELRDLEHHIVEFSCDQHGSRFIQHKLESASEETKNMVFSEVRPNSLQLMTDVFGNYVIQRLFELGSDLQRTILAKQMESHVLELSLQMYGCRVIQKAIEHINTDQQVKLVTELQGHVLQCVKDQNGNHVIQKTIEKIPADKTGFIIEAFQDQTYQLATHPYGCRVIQRMLEHSSEEAQKALLEELHAYTFYLVEDQYGNYVIQHVIEHGKQADKDKIIDIVSKSVMTFSRHKFASNVVEKCIIHGTAELKKQIIDSVLNPGPDGIIPISVMMKDQFANYVIQKLLDSTEGDDHVRLANSIRPYLTNLKKYSYGKHLASIEKLMSSSSE